MLLSQWWLWSLFLYFCRYLLCFDWWCWWIGIYLFLVALVFYICVILLLIGWDCVFEECVSLCLFCFVCLVCNFVFFVFVCFVVVDDSQLPMRTLWDLGVGVGSSPLFFFLWKFFIFFCIFFEFRGVLYYFDRLWLPVP